MKTKNIICVRLFSFLVLCFLLNALAFAQANKLPVKNEGNLVSYTLNAEISANQLNKRINSVFGQSGIVSATQAVDLYKVNYRSLDLKRRPVILSGLVALPKNKAPKGLVIFNHGTTADRNLSPSRYKGKADSSVTEHAILAFASGGYVVAMPDYLGLGDDKDFHPYPLGSINSRSAVDLIEPAREIAARQNVGLHSNLFITGYSEGGAVAMWTVYELEKMAKKNFRITAAAPMSGPYDLSDTTRKWLLASPTDKEGFVVRLYLLSYIIYSFHDNYDIKISDYFKPIMAFAVSEAYKKNRSDKAIIERLTLAEILTFSKNKLKNVLTKRFMKVLQNSDTSDPVIRELKNNDIYDWLPQTDMLLINLEGDQIVDPGSSVKAFRMMRKRGASSAKLNRFVIKDKNLNHLTAFAPSLLEARRFFDKKVSNEN